MRCACGISGFLFSVSIFAGTAFPCSCLQMPVDVYFADADAVFIGTPVDRSGAGRDQYAFAFAVERAWKGIKAHRTVVVTDKKGGTCGIPFEFGTSYFIFARRDDENAQLTAHLCNGTTLLSAAEPYLREIGPAPLRFVERTTLSYPAVAIAALAGILLGFAAAAWWFSRRRSPVRENL